jgi:hypothetical protein
VRRSGVVADSAFSLEEGRFAADVGCFDGCLLGEEAVVLLLLEVGE